MTVANNAPCLTGTHPSTPSAGQTPGACLRAHACRVHLPAAAGACWRGVRGHQAAHCANTHRLAASGAALLRALGVCPRELCAHPRRFPGRWAINSMASILNPFNWFCEWPLPFACLGQLTCACAHARAPATPRQSLARFDAPVRLSPTLLPAMPRLLLCCRGPRLVAGPPCGLGLGLGQGLGLCTHTSTHTHTHTHTHTRTCWRCARAPSSCAECRWPGTGAPP